MSSILLGASGVILLVVVTYDFLYTTISLAGLGPISTYLTRGLWHLGRWLTHLTEARLDLSLRGAIGPVILSTLAASWLALYLAAYVLLYLSGSSLETSGADLPANIVQIIAFSGSTLSTLGASTVEPTNGWWDILSMVAAINGMVVLTLSVTFVLNILQTTLSARNWALQYNILHDSADARGADRVPANVASLGPDLCNVAVTLTASPLTGYFVPSDPAMSFPKALSSLCDLMEEQGLTSWSEGIGAGELAELRAGLGLFGRHVKTEGGGSDFAAAQAWTERHSLPART